jgi:tetratricopeptide (TPR) repeat protein
MKNLAIPVMALGGLLLLAAPADALVMVVGNALAHDCYIAAKLGTDPRGGISTCNAALDGPLTAHDRAATMVNRASMEMQLNRVDAAMGDYDSAIKTVPEMGDAYLDRGGAFITLRRWTEALADVNKGLTLNPSAPFVGYYNRAVAEQLTGDYTNAYLDYTKVLTLEPAFTPAADRLKDVSVAKAGAALPPAPAPGQSGAGQSNPGQ